MKKQMECFCIRVLCNKVRALVCFDGCTSNVDRQYLRTHSFFIQIRLHQSGHLCFRLHECLDGIVITDHRLMLQRKLFPRSDSSYHRGPRVQSLRRIMDCVVLTHAHTDTYTHMRSYHSSFHFVPSPITPFHVNNGTRAPPLSSQNLLAFVFVNPQTEERERLRFKKKKKAGRDRQFYVFGTWPPLI